MATVISLGDDFEVQTFTVDGTATAITTAKPCKSFIIRERGGTVAMRFFRNSGDSVYFTINAGETFSANLTRSKRTKSSGTWTLCYLKSDDSSSITVEVIVTY